MSLILTGSEVMQVLDMDLALAAVEDAFRAYGEGRANMPPKAYLTLAHGDFRAMYGEIFLAQDHICGLKWVNVHPENPTKGLLTVMAKILLNDPDTGLEFADLDGTHITDYRTGAAGGVAARYLARSDATRLGLIGAGAQARAQVAAILKVRPIQEIVVYDRHLTCSRPCRSGC
jgi:alanine dehydrogenase